jgi:phage antirepressor YoqD-like protein
MHNQIAPRNTHHDGTHTQTTETMTRHVMSSREIAELTGSTHDNVLKTVRQLVKKGVVSSNETPYTHQQNGQTYAEFLLSYRDTMVVVSGYSVELRAKIIDRWQDLEEQAARRSSIPTNLPDALRLAADKAEENERLLGVIQLQAPKVAALQRLASTPGSVCLTDAAKHLGIGPLKLIGWLSSNRWIYRRTSFSNWSAFQPRLSAGLLEHKMVRINNKESEELKVVEQVMVTRRGLVVLAEKIAGLSSVGKV